MSNSLSRNQSTKSSTENCGGFMEDVVIKKSKLEQEKEAAKAREVQPLSKRDINQQHWAQWDGVGLGDIGMRARKSRLQLEKEEFKRQQDLAKNNL